MSASRLVRAAQGQTLRLLRERDHLLKLLRFARQRIHVKPPGLEDFALTRWGREVSEVLPAFSHWDGQPKANREAVECGKDFDEGL